MSFSNSCKSPKKIFQYIGKISTYKWRCVVQTYVAQGSTVYTKKLSTGLHYRSIHYSVHKRPTVTILHTELRMNTIIEEYRLRKTSLKRYLNILLNKTKL